MGSEDSAGTSSPNLVWDVVNGIHAACILFLHTGNPALLCTTLMRTFLRPMSAFLALQLTGVPLAVRAAPPVIQHETVKVAPRGKAKTMIARVTVPNGSVQNVNLYVTQSADASPLKIEMKPSGAPGTYFGTIPAAYLQSKGTLRYYIEAVGSDGDWKETNWMPIAVQDVDATAGAGAVESGDATIPPPDGSSSGKPGWFWPTVLIGGGALAVAGAVALADSGGGGGGSTTPVPDPGDEDIADRIITRTVRDDVENVSQSLPKDTVVDISDSLKGREVETVRIDLTVDAVDGHAENVNVLYKDSVVLQSGAVLNSVSRSTTISGNSPIVVVRVVSSDLDEIGNQNYSVTATITFILKKAQ